MERVIAWGRVPGKAAWRARISLNSVLCQVLYILCFAENLTNTHKDLDFLPPAVVYYYGEWK